MSSFEMNDVSTWNMWQLSAFVGVRSPRFRAPHAPALLYFLPSDRQRPSRSLVSFSLSQIVLLGLEILSQVIPWLCTGVFEPIPVKGKHLDEFEATDKLYIRINKLLTVVFTYHLFQYSWTSDSVEWRPERFGLINGPVALVAQHVIYDFFYSLFHRFLHIPTVYGWVHKHHHRQKAPSRGNLDAINVHPFEFVSGEYLHLLCIWMVPCHIFEVLFFIIWGGVLASLNHTRFDLSFLGLYSVKVHDVHHRVPNSNYGQYIMLWDKLMGTYRPYEGVGASSKKGR